MSRPAPPDEPYVIPPPKGQPHSAPTPTPPDDSYSATPTHLPDPQVNSHEDTFCLVFRYTPIPTIVLDSQLVIREVSESYVEVSSECRRESVVGLPADAFFDQHPAFLTTLEALEALEIAITAKRPYTRRCIDGQVTWDVRIVPIFRHGSLWYIQMEFQDVSEARRKQLELEEQLTANETFRILVETVKDYAIFMLDPGGHIATWNQGAQRFKGYKREEIIGRHFSQFYGQEDRENRKPDRELTDALRDGRVEDEGWRYRKDGSKFWANVVITPVYRGDTLLGFSKVTRDLSERRKAEAELISAYEESSKLKSDFLANMSHEIRTPMHGMLSALTLLLDTQLTAEQLELAGVIQQSGDLLLQVINDILDYSKLTSGTFTISNDVINFADVLQSVFRIHQRCCPPQLSLESYIDPRLPKAAEGDSLRYRQILQNFMSNALKFTEKGYVRMSATLQNEDEQYYTILTEVIDSGIGIPELVSGTLFTPFHQLDNSATKQHQGTGLGLSICKSLAELMGGQIGFHPNTDVHGSVFWFTARLKKVNHITALADNLEALNIPANDAPFEKMRLTASDKKILLAEDNPINQKVMKKMLTGLGFNNIDLATNGEEAVHRTTKDPHLYDLILMDINMPIVDGVGATKMIREAGIQTPIVAMTANALKGHAESYIAKGMTAYIPKPVDRNLLVKILLSCLKQESPT